MMRIRSLAILVAALPLGCASTLPEAGRPAIPITDDELLAGVPLGSVAGSPPLVEDHQVFLVTAEMRAFLDRQVARGADPVARLRQLGRGLLDEKSFGLHYDETTRTAAETFRARRGNCLSFSTLFVSLARGVGLTAHFQEVDTPPDWSLRNDVFVLNRHVNVVVELGTAGDHVVDFNLQDFRTSYDRRRISDTRALAHHDNNLAVERLQAGDAATAFRYLRRAVRRDPSFSPTWTNLGILYLRQGRPDLARAAYLRALAADERDLVAMSNLASLYERTGDHERAARYRSLVVDHRNRNPYYRFQLGREAVLARDYDAAIEHLKFAVGQRRSDDRFCFLLGLSYLGKGNERAARKWFARAERLAASDSQKRRYAGKADRVLSRPENE